MLSDSIARTVPHCCGRQRRQSQNHCRDGSTELIYQSLPEEEIAPKIESVILIVISGFIDMSYYFKRAMFVCKYVRYYLGNGSNDLDKILCLDKVSLDKFQIDI